MMFNQTLDIPGFTSAQPQPKKVAKHSQQSNPPLNQLKKNSDITEVKSQTSSATQQTSILITQVAKQPAVSQSSILSHNSAPSTKQESTPKPVAKPSQKANTSGESRPAGIVKRSTVHTEKPQGEQAVRPSAAQTVRSTTAQAVKPPATHAVRPPAARVVRPAVSTGKK